MKKLLLSGIIILFSSCNSGADKYNKSIKKGDTILVKYGSINPAVVIKNDTLGEFIIANMHNPYSDVFGFDFLVSIKYYELP